MTVASPRVGVQLPASAHVPLFHSSLGDDGVALALLAGLRLDEWQQHVLRCSLNMDASGRFAAKDMCVIVPRQNGKGSIIEARELAGLFLLPEKTIMHSAHEFRTAQEGYQRLSNLVMGCSYLVDEGDPKCTNSGAAGTMVRLQAKKYAGKRVVFSARSKGAGRGFTVDTVIFDEAYDLPDAALDAMSPMQTAVPNPQTWFLSSTGFDDSDVLRRMRNAGLDKSPNIGYFEFKADDDCDPADEDQWYKANPALGIRVDVDFLRSQHSKMSRESFAREHLGLWASTSVDALIPPHVWDSLSYSDEQVESGNAGIEGSMSFAVDVDPDARNASVYAAGLNADGFYHVECVQSSEGVAWVPALLQQLSEKWRPKSIALDPQSSASGLIPELNDLGVPYVAMSANDVKAACALFLNSVDDNRLRHRRSVDDPGLTHAANMGVKRIIGHTGAWAWARKDVAANITPLVASTYALYAFAALEFEKKRGGRMW